MIFVFLLGLFDRVRGSGWFKYNKTIGSLFMGVIMALLVGYQNWLGAYVILATFMGTKPGLKALEDVFDGKGNFSSLALRGIVWGGFLIPVYPLAALASFIGFVSSPYWARKLPYKGDKWAVMEFGRSFTTGLLILWLPLVPLHLL